MKLSAKAPVLWTNWELVSVTKFVIPRGSLKTDEYPGAPGLMYPGQGPTLGQFQLNRKSFFGLLGFAFAESTTTPDSLVRKVELVTDTYNARFRG